MVDKESIMTRTRIYRRLDLGGTACYCSPSDVSISLDGTNSDDEVTPLVIGDYTQCPFPSKCFDEAFGSCALEQDPFTVEQMLIELRRVLKPGATIHLGSCGEPEDWHTWLPLALGFKLIKRARIYRDEDGTPQQYGGCHVFKVPERR